MARSCSIALARRVLAGLVTLAACAPAHAAITIQTSPPTGPTFVLTPIGSKVRVTLNTSVTTSPTTFSIRGALTDQIEQININANVNQTVFVEVRGSATTTSPIASIDRIDKGTSSATVVLQNARTTGNVGPILVNTISDINVGGDITGDITLLPRTSGESTIVNGTVTGRVRGNIFVDHGAIFGFTAAGGLGAAGAPVQVRTRNNIVRLTAREIYADITTLSNGGSGWTGKIETTAGPFVGSLTTSAIASTGTNEPGVLFVAGDLDANVSIIGSVRNQNNGQPVVNVAGRLSPGRVFKIGTSLEPGAAVRFASAGGLAGQMIVNGWAGTGVWSGPVTVGGGTLGPVPEYTAMSSALGGGAVGLVPFMLHSADSLPARGATLSTAGAPTPSNPLRARFYGPVAWNGAQPLLVETRPVGSVGAWTDISACFSFGREPGVTPSANVVAAYPIRPMTSGQYRVRPVRVGSGALLCDIGLAPNPAVADSTSEYTFTILGGCAGDADGNGAVNFADISALLSSWGVAPGGGAGCFLPPIDVTGDGVVNFADVTLVLSNWGTSCS